MGEYMVTYFLNWMGPISHRWYEINKIPYTVETKYSEHSDREYNVKHYDCYYSTGRIDIHNGEPFGDEYAIGVMKSTSGIN